MSAPDWFESPAARTLRRAFAQAGEEVFFVGGCVRDAELGRAVGDLDAATPALPDAVQALLDAAAIRTLPTGLAHGTLTALIEEPDGNLRPIEITSFRRDEKTDGRHAEVAFRASIEEDAARRDFTINALYRNMDGALLDPTGQGAADLAARRLRFIGDPAQRLHEDALRSLRFYRFAAQLGLTELNASARVACAAAADRLEALSGERIQAEMLKLLATPAPARAWNAMCEDGVLAHLVPPAPAGEALDRAAAAEALMDLPPRPMLRLGVLLNGDAEAAEWIGLRWRMANGQRAALSWLTAQAPKPVPDMLGLRALIRKRDHADAASLLAMAVMRERLAPEEARTIWQELRNWEPPVFPLGGKDLLALGYQGVALGARLQALEVLWEESGYRLTREQLLAGAKEQKDG